MWEIDQVRQGIVKNQIPSVNLWYGEERFFIQEALQLLKNSYLAQDPSGSGIEILSGKSTGPEQIVEIANTVSFFGGKLIIVEDIPYFQDGQGDALEPFFAYFENPNPGTCLVFLAQSVNRGRKFFKAIEKKGSILEFGSPKRQQEWSAWLDRELAARGKTMKPQVKALFLEWGGHQVGALSQELDKLALFVEGKEIRTEDVRSLVPQAVEATVFELLDAVAARSAKEAVQKLQQVLRQEHSLKVLTLLSRQVRLLLGARAMRQQGRGAEEAPRLLGIKPYEAQKIWQKAAQLTWEQLSWALRECLETDVAIKTGKGEPEFLLELMVVKFCEM
ncbi:DNA polymerase III, delta subunit [Desulfitobacterium hafniense DP7]|uniref:DNA polymerase III subunit delta n=2 Tax=Desulfitobacterium hafniense TaxID=49338 RepID=A0A098B2Z7_DESHA|nr:DNA polymerase III subunit delta [Desulfitobacterium hafniense]EHL04507.1 DNA polymerase III, delta subunit [Desulfitobacterium hafniense DP7]CDX03254.1 DNA polymerase III, delta subunit [Desulfitobacterium hafniense]